MQIEDLFNHEFLKYFESNDELNGLKKTAKMWRRENTRRQLRWPSGLR